MADVARSSLDSCTGHGCFPPRNSSAGSSDVMTNSQKTLRKTDMYKPHACPNTGPHSGSVAKGSASVFVNSNSIARKADPISCGSFIVSGSGNVNAGDSKSKYSPPDFPDIPFSAFPNPQLKDTPTTSSPNVSPPGDTGDLPSNEEHIEDATEQLSSSKCGEIPLQNPADVAFKAKNTTRWDENGYNPNIVALWEEIGFNESFTFTSSGGYTAWCAGFVSATLKRAGCKYIKTASSRAYSNYGIPINWNDIQRGDVIVFYRKGRSSPYGHVGFATGNKTESSIEIIGGNQGDTLSVRNYKRGPGSNSGFLAARRATSCVDGTTLVPASGTISQPISDAIQEIGIGLGGAVS